MVDDDLELEEDLGQATIVYENPEGETVEKTVPNEHIAYFQDHWIIKTEERGDHDIVRRIPSERVYYTERSVEEFEEEIQTIRNRIESFAGTLRDRLPVGDEDDESPDSHKIEVGSETDHEQ